MYLFDDRVQIEPEPIHAGEKARIYYNGILAKSGADKVYLHYGIDGWKKPNTISMDKISDRFETEIKTTAGIREIDFCFKDSADHWDNNNGFNWKVSVE